MNRVAAYLADRYRHSKAGRTGAASRDLVVVFRDLLQDLGCPHGPERHQVLLDLEDLEKRSLIQTERHRRHHSEIFKIRLPLDQAGALFAYLDQPDPQGEREALAACFQKAAQHEVPTPWREGWQSFCESMAEAASQGGALKPFDRDQPEQTRQILSVLPLLLAWPGESLLRFASSLLFDDSKRLEALRPRLEKCLALITKGQAPLLSDFGIVENERGLWLHGPLRLRFASGEIDVSLLTHPVRISAADLRQATIETAATRCLTVENRAMLNELAKLCCGEILVSSGSEGGFAHSAVLDFLQRVPAHLELYHFGDADPKGFDILRDLRLRSGRFMRSLHMSFRPSKEEKKELSVEDQKTIDRLLTCRELTPEEKQVLQEVQRSGDKGRFEQESLGRPMPDWPFY